MVDPLARWCGGWGRKTPGYPISPFLLVQTFLGQLDILSHFLRCLNFRVWPDNVIAMPKIFKIFAKTLKVQIVFKVS